jgi:hypothetical protein
VNCGPGCGCGSCDGGRFGLSDGAGENPAGAAADAAPWERSVGWGPVGWKPLSVDAPWQQNAVFGERVLSQYPARWEGAFLRNGVGEIRTGWMEPYPGIIPYWQVTTYPQNVPGAQLYGGAPGQPSLAGPIASRGLKASVLAAQVKQSGLQTMSWANQIGGWASMPPESGVM